MLFNKLASRLPQERHLLASSAWISPRIGPKKYFPLQRPYGLPWTFRPRRRPNQTTEPDLPNTDGRLDQTGGAHHGLVHGLVHHLVSLKMFCLHHLLGQTISFTFNPELDSKHRPRGRVDSGRLTVQSGRFKHHTRTSKGW